MAKHACRIPESQWERHKEQIISVYSGENSTLERTMTIMQERHGFKASKNQYRTRLKRWKLGKNATTDIWTWVGMKMRQRESQGKATQVFLHNKRLSRQKVMKEIARNVTFTKTLPPSYDTPTPEGISIATPPGSPSALHERPSSLRTLPGTILHDFLEIYYFLFEWDFWECGPDMASMPGPLRNKASQELFYNATLDFGYYFEDCDELKVVETLLDAGADINRLHPKHNVTGLQLALHRGHGEMAKFLLERGATANIPARFGVGTALQEAIRNDQAEIIDIILEQGVYVNATPSRDGGGTALQLAAKNGMFWLADRLLKLGAHVAAAPAAGGGRTAIDGAAENGRIDMLRLLLKAYKGDENISDICRRAAECADKAGHVVTAEWLREYSP
ncbi:ankyrin repeat-containing domain protein [Aspergillus aurantiobrunneus]